MHSMCAFVVRVVCTHAVKREFAQVPLCVVVSVCVCARVCASALVCLRVCVCARACASALMYLCI